MNNGQFVIWVIASALLVIVWHDVIWPYLQWRNRLWRMKRIIKRIQKKDPDDPTLKEMLELVGKLREDLHFGEPPIKDED